MTSDYFPTHSHTDFSVMDGMAKVADHVARVAELGQPGFTLTDHGTMAGCVRAYQACKKFGIASFLGVEFYVVRDVADPDTRGDRWHLGIMALDFIGYQALTKLVTLSFKTDHFYRKPLIDLSDLAFLHDQGYAKHLAVTTGCYSGLVTNEWKGPDPQAHAMNMVWMLQKWFPNLYVELHNHGITWPEGHTDLDIANDLFIIARTEGVPVLIGGDSHYIHASDQPVHDLMKDICYFGDGEDFHFSGGPYHLLSSGEAIGAFPAYMTDAIEEGHGDLLDKHRLTIPALDKYKFHVPTMVKDDPHKVLVALVAKGMVDRGLNSQDYLAQCDEEMLVVKAMEIDNYFLLFKEHVTDWCRDNGIIINVRGSANGSLFCYALGITNVDPLVWGTSFPRFLSLDRMKPPDIDVDVDFRGRPKLVEHLGAVWPTMTQVGTYAKIGSKTDEFGEEVGSAIVQYMSAMSRKDPKFDGKVKKEHWPALNALNETTVFKSMGTNAAGFILPGEGLTISDYLPLGRIISSDTTLTQYSKDDVEALGYLKIDVLGLRALQTLNGTLVRIGRQPNDWDWIPYDDPDACKLLRSGNGCGIFQFEGFSCQRGGKELGVKSTLDAMLVLALYRPALMNGGQKDLYLANRGKSKARQTRLHPLFDAVVKDTAGVPIFQEQIMEMLKVLGMKFAEWNELMTAVKASSGYIAGAAKTFQRLMPVFYDLCEDAGMTGAEADTAWGAVIGFTEYGFNRGHAAAYGLMSYFAAYLKAHYPLEYMVSVLDVWVGVKDKERLYTAESRRLGFSIVKADVNFSQASWEVEPGRVGCIRRALASLPGIGEKTATNIVSRRPVGGYTDIAHFIRASKVSGGKEWKKQQVLSGVCLTLQDQGAFRSMTP